MCSFWSLGSWAHAQSFGVYGQVYPIIEQDAIAAMKNAVRDKLANGGEAALLKGAQDRYMASLKNVVTPPGLTPAKANASRLVDLTEVAQETVLDPQGRVLLAAGTRINPLTVMPLNKKLFFIDAKDKRQLALVKARASSVDKVILLGGSVFDAGEALQRHVYLDVPGFAQRMQIRRLPSIVSQQGDRLLVQEVAP